MVVQLNNKHKGVKKGGSVSKEDNKKPSYTTVQVFLGKESEPLAQAWSLLRECRPSVKNDSDLGRQILTKEFIELGILNEDGSLNQTKVKQLKKNVLKPKDLI